MAKGKTIFDYFNDIFRDKTPWEDFDEIEKKNFNSYMTQRWLSMRMDYLPIINEIQIGYKIQKNGIVVSQ